jgi:hypothetical protein
VTITSFVLIGQNTPAAELCGKVSGAATEFSVVRVVVDPNSKHPAVYNVLAGQDGAFCAAVMTYYGEASASVSALNKSAASPVARASFAYPR